MNIFRKIARLLPLAAIALLASCSDRFDTPEPENQDIVVKDGKIYVSTSLNVPAMHELSSRAMGDIVQEGLTVKALEFSWNTTDSASFLQNVYDVEVVSATTAAPNLQEVNIKMTLNATTDPVILLLIATDANLGTISYGSMAAILQSLWVSNGEVAYFGQVRLGNGYGTTEPVTNTDGTVSSKFIPHPNLDTLLKGIPMLRNYAKISCQESLDNFTLTGFELINIPTSGTVAPWDPVNGVLAEIIDPTTKKMKPYSDLHKGYVGMLAPSSEFRNTEADIREGRDVLNFSMDPQYMYAHPYEPYSRTYMLVRGVYGNDEQESYYKIDLGYTDSQSHLFVNYNIIRNYHYVVTINSVARSGYPTAEEAMNGTVFNNLSASTETRDMLSLSDGQNLLGVNMTRAEIVTNTNPIIFKYSYRTGLDSGGKGTVDNSKIKVINLDSGAVINRFVGPVTVGDSIQYTIYPNAPDSLRTLEQSFTVVDPQGLGRTITLVSHLPYKMNNIEVYGNNYNLRPSEMTKEDSVGAAAGSPVTLFFDLPDGIPASVFPLKFVIESNRQNLENNSAEGAALVVTTAPSMFSATNDPRVAYIRTVTYEQYMYQSDENNKVDIDENNTYHTIRNRFRTTIGLSNIPGEPDTMLTRLKIYNPYFEMGEVSFVRKKGQ